MRRLRLAPLVILVPALLSGCNSGLAAIFGANKDEEQSNAPAAITAFNLAGQQTSPATLRFRVIDADNDTAVVSLYYQVVGGSTQLMTQLGGAANPKAYAGSPNGTEHVLSWDFAAESELPSDGGYMAAVNVWAQIEGTSSIILGANASQLGLGNDAPVVDAVETPSGEVFGVVPIGVAISDSSTDLVDLRVEWQIVGDANWQLARPGGEDNTPALAVRGLSAPAQGVEINFFWDTSHDLPKLERDVVMRFTPIDATVEGVPYVTPPFRVDNNQAPIIDLDNGLIVYSSDDALGGIGIPFSVRDAESDKLRIIFQWRRGGESFVPLPSDPEQAFAIQDDPALRRQYRVCSVNQDYAEGRVQPVAADRVRLPETGTSKLPISRPLMIGRTIDFLRHAKQAVEVTADWQANSLSHAVAAVPVGDGLDALVLDEPSSASWRLRRVALASGEPGPEIASGAGLPTALSIDMRGETAFVTTWDGGGWDLHRVELADGNVTTAAGNSAALAGPRGVAALSSVDAVLTVGNELVRVRFAPSGPSVRVVATNLAEPWGVARDPLDRNHVVVAERTADRVVHVRLSDGSRRDVLRPDPSAAPQAPQVRFPSPRAVAFEREGERLLVVTDDGGQRQLRGLDRNSGHDLDGTGYADATAFVLSELPANFGDALATGANGLSLLCAANADQLVALGGVQQRRVVQSFDGTSNVAILDAPLHPQLAANQRWRMPRFDQSFGSSAIGLNHTFSWDSRDLVAGGSVFFRAVAFDSEFGIAAQTSVERSIRAPFGARRVSLATSTFDAYPDAQPVDYDGDGDLDVMLRDGGEVKVIEQTAPGRFAAPVSLGLSLRRSNRLQMVYADLDSDGLLDVAHCGIWNSDDQTLPPVLGSEDSWLVQRVVEIFYGTAPGEFSKTPELLSVPQKRQKGLAILGQMQALDYDRDGALDLVMTRPAIFVNEIDGTDQEGLLVFRRTAPRSYAAPEAIALDVANDFEAITTSFSIDDIDGDGHRDVLCAQNGPHGAGGVGFGAGNGGLSIHFGDATGGYEPTPLLIRRFEFASQAYYGYDMGSAHCVVLVDLDEDGDLDIVSSSANGAYGGPGIQFPSLSGKVTVHLQLEPRVFSEIPLVVGSQGVGLISAFASGLAVEDINADGLQDILVTSNDGIRIHYASAPGVFSRAPLVIPPQQSYNNYSREYPALKPCDLDGDGDLDLVGVDVMTAEVFALFQVSKGIESVSSAPLIIEQAEMTNGARLNDVADMDADGDLDLIISNHGFVGTFSTNKVTIFEQVSPRSFASVPQQLPADGSLFAPGPVIAADLDFDGDNDFAVVSVGTNELQIFYQEAPGVFSDSLKFSGPERVSWSTNAFHDAMGSLEIADVDLDGDLDLFSAPNLLNRVFVLEQDAGVFAALPTFDHLLDSGVQAGASPRAVRAADLDADGTQELLFVAGLQGLNGNLADPPNPPYPKVHEIVIFEGAGALESDPDLSVIEPAGDSFLLVEDFDGDGRLDLYVSGLHDHTAPFSTRVSRIFYGKAEGGYDMVEYPIAVKPAGNEISEQLAATTDWDGDGDLDLVVLDGFHGLFPGTLKVYEQLRPRVFARIPTLTGPTASAVTIRDVDGDGEKDVTLTQFQIPAVGRTTVLWGNE